jgi:hypothetical protein
MFCLATAFAIEHATIYCALCGSEAHYAGFVEDRAKLLRSVVRREQFPYPRTVGM